MISLHYKETNYLHCYCKKNYLKNQIKNLKAKNTLPNKSGNPESLKK